MNFDLRKFCKDYFVVPKVIYFLINLAFYSCYTFRPTFLKEAYGIEKGKYGLIAAFFSLVIFLAAFFWGFVVDRTGKPKFILFVTAVEAALIFQLFNVGKRWDLDGKFIWASVISMFYIWMVSGMMPVLDGRMLNWLTEEGYSKELYGRQRLWGTVGYCCITLIVSAFPKSQYPVVIPIIVGITTALFLLGHYFLFPEDKKERSERKEKKGEVGNKSVLAAFGQLFTNFNFMFLLLVVFINGFARAIMTTYLQPLQSEIFKSEEWVTGVSSVTGVLFEVIVFFYSKELLAYLGKRRMLLIAQLGMIGRVACYAFLPYDYDAVKYAPIFYELFKGINFGFMQGAGVQLALELAPPELKSTAQSLFTGVFSGLSAFAAGLFGFYTFTEIDKTLPPAERSQLNIDQNRKMLAIVTYGSIGALVLFLVKYILFDEFILAKKENKIENIAMKNIESDVAEDVKKTVETEKVERV